MITSLSNCHLNAKMENVCAQNASIKDLQTFADENQYVESY